jgi:hypothetical protein
VARRPSLTQRIVEVFLTGNLAPLPLLLSFAAGGVALLVTPREEDPQIVVPVADVVVDVPGASALEVERQVAIPPEQLVRRIDGVEYVYSMSRRGQAIVTARFHVGEDREDSLVKLHSMLQRHAGEIPRCGPTASSRCRSTTCRSSPRRCTAPRSTTSRCGVVPPRRGSGRRCGRSRARGDDRRRQAPRSSHRSRSRSTRSSTGSRRGGAPASAGTPP